MQVAFITYYVVLSVFILGHEQMFEHSNVRLFMQHSSVDFFFQTFVN